MKKVAAILLILSLLCSAAYAKVLNCRNLFSIEYPFLWADYGVDSSEDLPNEYYELGFIGGRQPNSLCIVLHAYYLPDYAGLRLFEADYADIANTAHELMANYGETELIEIRYASEHKIPFIIFECDYGYGPELMALTISNGWMIMLNGYAFQDAHSDDLRDLSETDIQTFMNIVSSFVPIVK